MSSSAKRADRTPSFGGREYPYVVELDIGSLAHLRNGLELAPLVPRLNRTFPDPATWSVRMRRALVLLDAADAAEIEHELEPHVVPYSAALRSYDGLVT